MKTFIFGLALFLASDVVAKPLTGSRVSDFAPENDLWKEDNVGFVANVDEDMFKAIIEIAKEIYAPTAKQWNETLVINGLWTDSTVNANASRDMKGWTEINMYGGLARRKEVIPYGFALVLCHELNHLYGGAPYVEPSLYLAAEGQSDFSGAGWCLKNIVDRLGYMDDITVTEYMARVCGKDLNCVGRLAAANSLGGLLSVLSGDRAPNLETPDPLVVKKTNVSYPKTTQCRVDTYLNGVLGKDRPLCWFKP